MTVPTTYAATPAGAAATANLPYDSIDFAPIRESAISREMITRYMHQLNEAADTDVIVIGAGPAGLMAAYELSKDRSIKVAVIEASVAPGGGAWIGGQLMTPMVVRKPAHLILDELEVKYDDVNDQYVVLPHAGLLTATLIKKIIENGVTLFNATAVEDFVVKNGRVCGVATNWGLVTRAHGTQNCMDPNTLLAKVIVSTCGHDGPHGATGIKRMQQIGLWKEVPGMGALDVFESEKLLVQKTGELVPGFVVAGMEVAEAFGTPRMGACFSGCVASGRKAGHLAAQAVYAARAAEKAQQ